VFGITQVLPADAATMLLGENATPDQLAAIRERLGLNDPIWTQYLRWLGGVPVDRRTSHNYVQQIADLIHSRDRIMLMIAPEGTRGRAGEWKTGFYYIALGAKVPMVCGMMDYGRKVVSLGRAIMPTGDYEADMAVLKTIYSNCTPKHPQGATY
jgi:1-acyl-sn-glycerol-3-phosphate acyltransferase